MQMYLLDLIWDEKEIKIVNSIPLWILRTLVLNKLAGQSGFTDMELYGGFKYQPYSLEAFSTVLLAKKP